MSQEIEWYPVKYNFLPLKSGVYIVTVSGKTTISYYDEQSCSWVLGEGEVVEAWANLPEPYESPIQRGCEVHDSDHGYYWVTYVNEDLVEGIDTKGRIYCNLKRNCKPTGRFNDELTGLFEKEG